MSNISASSINADIGLSDKPEAKIAGSDACRQALKSVVEPKLLVVFASARYDQKEVFAGAAAGASGVPLIGCSTAGEITPFGPARGSVAALALGGGGLAAAAAVGGTVKESSRQAGLKLGQNAAKNNPDLRALLIFSDILTGNGDEILAGVQEGLGKNVLIAGAAAADDFSFRETYVCGGGEPQPSFLAGAVLGGDCRIGAGVRHGWTPIGLPVKITKSHGALVEEINERPAIEFYVDNFGQTAEELKKGSFAQLAITYPLGRNTGDGDELAIRYPVEITARGAIRFTAGIPAGSEVRLMLGSRDEALLAAESSAAEAKAMLGPKKPRAVLVFSGVARSKLLAQHAGREIDIIKNVIGEKVPLAGGYVFGEFSSIKKGASYRSSFYNESIVVVAVG